MFLIDFGHVNQDVIEVNNDENIKLFDQDFVDISLEATGGIEKTERNNLILEIAVLHLEGCFPLVALLNFYLMISVCQVSLSKMLTAT